MGPGTSPNAGPNIGPGIGSGTSHWRRTWSLSYPPMRLLSASPSLLRLSPVTLSSLLLFPLSLSPHPPALEIQGEVGPTKAAPALGTFLRSSLFLSQEPADQDESALEVHQVVMDPLPRSLLHRHRTVAMEALGVTLATRMASRKWIELLVLLYISRGK
ncbi:hypothetical protein F4808DRAFT_358212 [Astrocystis sublimbata]|nr:hypothetical protein F4808DRAFT_358212 [Astrocystis sublimbata]